MSKRTNPYNELKAESFLDYLAQNEYMVDGGYLPEGVRLLGVRDELASLRIRFDELLAEYKKLAEIANEADKRVDELLEERWNRNRWGED